MTNLILDGKVILVNGSPIEVPDDFNQRKFQDQINTCAYEASIGQLPLYLFLAINFIYGGSGDLQRVGGALQPCNLTYAAAAAYLYGAAAAVAGLSEDKALQAAGLLNELSPSHDSSGAYGLLPDRVSQIHQAFIDYQAGIFSADQSTPATTKTEIVVYDLENLQNAATKVADAVGILAEKRVVGWNILTGTNKTIGQWLTNVVGTFNRSPTRVDPIVFDLNGDGIALTALASSNAYFDLYGIGHAVKTGWVDGNDGLLVVDRNGDGLINDISELFGNATTDGFASLKTIDSNNDNIINASDAAFSTLRMWVDANGNGVTDTDELKTLASLGITSINLNSSETNIYSNGNVIGAIGSYTTSSGTTGQVGDAFFNNSKVDTTYTGTYTLNPEVLLLPNLRGYGNLPDLFIAMSLDPTLFQMVKDFANTDMLAASTFDTQITALIYRWAGVESVSTTGRGAYVNGRQLAALEAFMGETFVRYSLGVAYSDPASSQEGALLTSAWNQLYDGIKQRLIIQGAMAEWLPDVSYTYDTDSLVGTPDFSTAMTKVATTTPVDPTEAAVYWAAIVPTLISYAKELGVDSSTYQTALNAAFVTAGLANSAAAIAANGVVFGDNAGDYQTFTGATTSRYVITGGGADSVFTGAGDDVVTSGDGNDTVRTAAGNDFLYGGNGDDVLDGGAGTNTMYGGNGNDAILSSGTGDKIYGGDGDDVVTLSYDDKLTGAILDGGAGQNTLVVNSGSYDLSLVSSVANFQKIVFGSCYYGGIIFNNTSVKLRADEVVDCSSISANGNTSTGSVVLASAGIYDFRTISLVGINSLYGSNGDDVIYGSLTTGMTIDGSGGANTIYGGNGNDTISTSGIGSKIYGGEGDDVFVVSVADRTGLIIDGGSGNNILKVGNVDTSGLTGVWNVQTLDISTQKSIKISGQDLAVFGTITAGSSSATASFITACSDTYDFSGKTLIGNFSISDTTGQTNTIYGTGAADNITIKGTGDKIYAGDGNDTITLTNLSLATLAGGVIDGGTGTDTLICLANMTNISSLSLIANIDTLDISAALYVRLTGEELTGIDSVTLGSATAGGSITGTSAGTYDYRGKTLIGKFNIAGSDYNDIIYGSSTLGMTISAGAGTNTVYGGAGDDTITSSGTGDQIYGGGGNDLIYMTSLLANQSGMVFDGGDGADILLTTVSDISGLSQVVNVETLALNNVSTCAISSAESSWFGLISSTRTSTLTTASSGSYNFSGANFGSTITLADQVGQTNTIFGSSGADNLKIYGTADQIYTGTGDDIIMVATNNLGNTSINGGDGVDTLKTQGYSLGVTAISNVETLDLTGGSTSITGAALSGFSTITAGSTTAYRTITSVNAGTYDLSGKTLVGCINLEGSSGNDVLIGGTTTTSLIGGAGNDNLTAGTIGCSLNAGDGTNILNGGVGNDSFFVTGTADMIYAGAGDDGISMYMTLANQVGSVIDGGAGNDTLYIGYTTNSACTASDISGLTNITNMETLSLRNLSTCIISSTISSAFTAITANQATTLTTVASGTYDFRSTTFGNTFTIADKSEQTNTILGSQNTEIITVNGIADQIFAQAGDDTIIVNTYNLGAALLDGGSGSNTLQMGRSCNISSAIINNIQTLNLNSIGVTLTSTQLSGFTNVTAGSASSQTSITAASAGTYDLSGKTTIGRFYLNGSTGDDTLAGGSGNDSLYGNGGNDTYLFGRGYGKDSINNNRPVAKVGCMKTQRCFGLRNGFQNPAARFMMPATRENLAA